MVWLFSQIDIVINIKTQEHAGINFLFQEVKWRTWVHKPTPGKQLDLSFHELPTTLHIIWPYRLMKLLLHLTLQQPTGRNTFLLGIGPFPRVPSSWKMSRKKFYLSSFTLFILNIVLVQLSFPELGSVRFVKCQTDDFTPPQLQNPSYNHYPTRTVYDRLSNLTSIILTSEIVEDYTFCINDPSVSFPFYFAINSSENAGK